ncbi:MAG: OsmC family peroxiredoxin [Neisseriaceae bacterium]|jgi:uncharacterized OsmC-like protein|nr:hypothetical protein [Pseudomonadota bacterium]RTL02342.1 MAG: OsmC family peroxiredoxin [Neisseriaceae bacterium]
MSDSEGSFVITLEQQKDFQFLVKWDNPNVPELLVDEAAPLGEDAGPNPSRILSLAVANCLSASLLFALRKFKNQPEPLKATVTTQMVRNEKNRLRVGKIAVDIQMGAAAADLQHLERVLAQFEDFCVVKESVRSGFAVDVTVRDGSGVIVKQP